MLGNYWSFWGSENENIKERRKKRVISIIFISIISIIDNFEIVAYEGKC